MKIDIKLPGGGQLKIEREPGDGFAVLYVFLFLCLVGFFALIWALR